MRRSRRLLLVAVPAGLLAAITSLAFFSAQRTLSRASRNALTANQLAFSLRPLDPVRVSEENVGFEPVASTPGFTCGAFFEGDLYLGEAAGLSVYAADGTLRRRLRTGMELPVGQIEAMASGRLRGAADSQLVLATKGDGLLLLNRTPDGTDGVQQLLPAEAGLRDVTAILPLASGDVVMGTRHDGALLFDGSTLTRVSFSLSGVAPARLDVTTLAAGDSGSYFMGTRNAGLFYLHGGMVQHADASSGLPDNQVEAIVTANGRAFAGTPLGVAQFELSRGEAGVTLRSSRVLAAGLFSHALALDGRASELTIGSLDQGIQQLRLDARAGLRRVSMEERAGDEGMERVDQFLAQAGSPVPLYAIANGALMVRGRSGWMPGLPLPAQAASLTDNDISALAFDGDGRLYVGFFDRGLDIFDPARPTAVRHLEDDHLFCVNRLALDPERRTMAAATANGLVLFDGQGAPRQVLTRRDGLISDHVTDIAFTRSGTALATPAGITTITRTGTESLYAFQGLVNNHVYALAGSPKDDRLMAGTLGGLSLLEGGTVRRNFTATNSGLKHNWITAMAATADGSTFIGTYGAGILRYTAEKDGSAKFTPIDLPAGTPRDLVINPNAVFATATHVYAGTLGHGMLVYTGATGRWSHVTQGLPSLNVTAFADRKGELYVGTENGLVRIAEDRLQ